jgi:hypothetical protein
MGTESKCALSANTQMLDWLAGYQPGGSRP